MGSQDNLGSKVKVLSYETLKWYKFWYAKEKNPVYILSVSE